MSLNNNNNNILVLQALMGGGTRGGGNEMFGGGRNVPMNLVVQALLNQGSTDPHGTVGTAQAQGLGFHGGMVPPNGPSVGGGYFGHQRHYQSSSITIILLLRLVLSNPTQPPFWLWVSACHKAAGIGRGMGPSKYQFCQSVKPE